MLAKRIVAVLLMLIMSITPVAVVSAVENELSDLGADGSFVPRLTAPKSSNKYYYSDLNKYERYGYGMPNCTAYAWGRAYEIMGYEPDLSLNDADTWWQYNKDNKSYSYGKTPKLGAVACWNYTDGGGHVAVVEQIKNGKITFSNSAYGGKTFYLTYADVNDSNGGIYDSTWVFQGYIYIASGQTKEDYYQSLGGDVYRVTSSDGINLRKGAGTSYSALTAIPNGTQIVVKGTKKADGYTWGKTSYDGYTGWCVLEYAKLIYKYQKPTTVPPTTATPTTTLPPLTQPTTVLTEPTEPPTTAVVTIDEATFDEIVATEPAETVTTVALPTEPTSQHIPLLPSLGMVLSGDANGDGKLSISDATAIQKHIAKMEALSEENLKAADLNGDGKITVADATVIQKKLAGIL